MPNKKLLLHSILNQTAPQDSGDDSVEESELDSDEELQRDFAEGRLKPGLNQIVPFKRTFDLINDKNGRLSLFFQLILMLSFRLGMKQKLKDIEVFKDNWIERLDLVSKPAPISQEMIQQYGDLNLKLNRFGETSGEELAGDSAQHDFKREMLFYRQAQTTVMEATKKLRSNYGFKQILRPDDYFAEMAKSDVHMKKVRERLQAKQNSIEASEKAKKLRELKKYGKKVQQEVQLKRQKEKKELLQKIQNYKKGKEESLDFLDDDGSNKKPTATRQPQRKQAKQTKKQKYKEARYGYGGQKKRSKYNSSESAANVSSFSVRKHGRPKLNGKKGGNRPGKARRQKMKQKQK